MNSHGELVFDVNDFDEAYLGPFSWDLRRFLASLALMGWQKALPEEAIRGLSQVYLDAYLEQVHGYVEGSEDGEFALRLDNTTAWSTPCSGRRGAPAGSTCSTGSARSWTTSAASATGAGVRRLPKAEIGWSGGSGAT